MIRLLIVDDHRLLRRGIHAVVRDAPDIAIAGEAETAAEAVRETARLRPDVVTLDLGLPDRSGLDVLPDLLRAHPDVRVLVLSVRGDEASVRGALGHGAAGYLMKDVEPEQMLQAIRSVAKGQGYLSPSVVPEVARVVTGSAEKAALQDLRARGLTDREIEVLLLMRRGRTDREIAQLIQRSEGTVKTHVHNILRKLDVRNRTEAAAIVSSLHLE